MDPGPWVSIALSVLGGLALGLLPPLTFHLVLETDKNKFSASAGWRAVLAGFYAAAVAVVLVGLLEGTNLGAGWTALLDRAPAISLTAASALGLLFIARWDSRSVRRPCAAAFIRVLLALMLACALTKLG